MLTPLSLAMNVLAAAASTVVATKAPQSEAMAVTIEPSSVVATQQLHYRKMYEAKPFPNAALTYYANGVYRIVSEGEDHNGVYVMQGRFSDETYTVRYISLPSEDWGHRTAYHQLTFINGASSANGVFIQDATIDTGEVIAQQNGTFITQTSSAHGPALGHAAPEAYNGLIQGQGRAGARRAIPR